MSDNDSELDHYQMFKEVLEMVAETSENKIDFLELFPSSPNDREQFYKIMNELFEKWMEIEKKGKKKCFEKVEEALYVLSGTEFPYCEDDTEFPDYYQDNLDKAVDNLETLINSKIRKEKKKQVASLQISFFVTRGDAYAQPTRKGRTKPIEGQKFLDDLLVIPVTTDGAALEIWYGEDNYEVGKALHIPLGLGLVVRSNVYRSDGLRTSADTESYRVYFNIQYEDYSE